MSNTGAAGYFKEKNISSLLKGLAKYLATTQPSDPLDGVEKWLDLCRQQGSAAYEDCPVAASLAEEAEAAAVSPNAISTEALQKCKTGPMLGKGSFAKVYLGILPNGQYVAVKRVSVCAESAEELKEALADAQRELSLMAMVHHKNIVQCFGSHYDEEDKVMNIYMEYVGGKTLADISRLFGGLETGVVRDYTRQILEGIAALHNKGICHRDIKPENILVDESAGVLKLCDFGCSKQIDRLKGPKSKGCTTVAGSPYHLSPEIIQDDEGYDGMKADMWSVGATVIQMLIGELPWPKQTSDMAAIWLVSNAQGPPSQCPGPEKVGEDCFDFIQSCCKIDPNARLSASEALKHPFLTS